MAKRKLKSKRLIEAERSYDRSASKRFPGSPDPRTYDELLRAQYEDYKERERSIRRHNARGTGTSSWIVYFNDKKPSSYGYLKTARQKAQENANATGRSVQIYASQGKKAYTVSPKRANPIRYGTSYFVSRSAAIRYYKDYGDNAASVDTKIREGSIHIGKPPLKPGDVLMTTDGGKRYMIQSANSKSNPIGSKLTHVRVKVGNKIVPGMARRKNGRVQVFVTPQVMRKVNPSAQWYVGVKESGEVVVKRVRSAVTQPWVQAYGPFQTSRGAQEWAKKVESKIRRTGIVLP